MGGEICMKTQDIYTLGTEELEDIMNQTIGVYLKFLLDNEYITTDQYNDLVINYAVILKRPSFFSKAWQILKGKSERPHIIIVKQQNLQSDEDEKEEEKNPKIQRDGIVLTPDFKNEKDKNEEDE
jgi:hypothetical protein